METTNRRRFMAQAAGALLAAGGHAMADADTVLDDNRERDWPADAAHARAIADAEKSVADAVPRAVADRLRPMFHFRPAARFTNDPNGCVYHNGAFHLFYQHLPYWGEPNAAGAPGWGHAVSSDLVHWQHEPIALMPMKGTYDEGAIASGACAIVDGQPTIVYTSVPPQAQSLARSFDGMHTWRKYAHNPVISGTPDIAGLGDGFRDPFVWREGDEWRMAIGSGVRGLGGTILLYRSPDFLKWEFVGQLCTGMGPDCFQWECPNFFKLGDKWVLIVSPLLHSEPALRGMVQYSVGDYDGARFEPGPWRPLDLGGPGCFYAPNSLLDPHGRRILWGWLMGGGSPGSMWDGLMTVPWHVELGADDTLRLSPVREVEKLRADALHQSGPRPLQVGHQIDLARGVQLDAVVELDADSSGTIELSVFDSPARAKATRVRWDLGEGRLSCGEHGGIVERGGSGARTLRVIVDRSAIEVFADSRAAMSLRAHPELGDDALRLAAVSGRVGLKGVRVWRMASVW